MQKMATCLMFVGDQNGKATEAMDLYVSLFEHSSILSIERYSAGDDGPEGMVKHARFSLGGQELVALDGGSEHQFGFTPAISLFVNCATEGEIDRLFLRLSEGGTVLMELDRYPFSDKFGWVQDRFGISWQLNLGKVEGRR